MAMDYKSWLNNDVVGEILSRLPVKSLLRFKGVCKSWYDIIASSSTFLKSHLQNYNKSSLIVVQLGHVDHDIDITTLKLPAMLPQYSHANSSFLPSFKETIQISCPEIVGSIDGLICVYGTGTGTGTGCCKGYPIALFNPSLAKFQNIILKSPKPPSSAVVEFIQRSIGFGFEFATKDIKLVELSSYICWSGSGVRTYMHLYSQNTSSWRPLDFDGSDFVVVKPVVPYNNGSLRYWLAHLDEKPFLVSFDMHTELFQTTQLPRIEDIDPWTIKLLPKDDDALVLFMKDDESTREMISFHRWELKGLGSHAHWTKLSSIRPLSEVYRPKAYWKNHSLVWRYKDKHTIKFVVYDCCDDQEIDGIEVLHTYDIEVPYVYDKLLILKYKESLVSLH